MIIKKIFNLFGYTFTKHKKSEDMDEIISLRLSLKPADILIDVGANHGDFSYMHMKKFEKIYMIEPNEDLIKSLSNKFNNKKYKIFKFGTSNKNKKTILYKTNDKGKTLSSIKEQTKEMGINFRNTKIVDKVQIQLKRLDSFLKTINIKNESIFLKVDTQGNDLETLNGIGKYIKNIKYIKTELPSVKLYNTNYSHWNILEFLKKKNFKPVVFENISRKKNGELIEYDAFFEKC